MNPKTYFRISFFVVWFVSMVFFHELTHVVLNGFRFDGVCFLNCGAMDNAGVLGNGYTPLGVYLSEPVNALAKNEFVAHASGIVTGFLFTNKVIK